MTPEGLPGISVVVIGRNEGPRLVRCLESLRSADYPGDMLELIYVDSASIDASREVAGQCGALVIEVRSTRPTAAVARNAGFAKSTHQLVHFFDGDTIVHPAWFRRAVESLEDDQVACVFGRREEMYPGRSIYNLWAHYDWFVPPGPAHHCAGDALFRRAVLERSGGFDESLIAGEEPDLCQRIRSRLGMVILSVDAPMTLHDIHMTRFGQYWRRCVRTGHAYAEVGGRHRNMTHWRRMRRRNVVHALVAAGAWVASIVWWNPWPIIAWLTLLAAAIARNGHRLRRRTGSWSRAIRYSFHHYLSKFPMAWGQLDFWVRRAFRRRPRSLIEYR